jgi:hypothetical protein
VSSVFRSAWSLARGLKERKLLWIRKKYMEHKVLSFLDVHFINHYLRSPAGGGHACGICSQGRACWLRGIDVKGIMLM